MRYVIYETPREWSGSSTPLYLSIEKLRDVVRSTKGAEVSDAKPHEAVAIAPKYGVFEGKHFKSEGEPFETLWLVRKEHDGVYKIISESEPFKSTSEARLEALGRLTKKHSSLMSVVE